MFSSDDNVLLHDDTVSSDRVHATLGADTG